MEYCSLSDAFPELNTVARKEEKKKAKRCKGPPLSFLEPGDQPVVDPDRPALRPNSDVPPINKETGVREHAPVDAEPLMESWTDTKPSQQLIAQLQSQTANPQQQELLNAMPTVSKALPGSKKPKYFGANYDDSASEGFATFTTVIGDDPAYRLGDFANSFKGQGANKATGLPTPSVVDVWKPLTPTGATTSYFNSLPPPGGIVEPNYSQNQNQKEEYFKKLDTIYARLDELESRRSENSQTEVLLFIMSGIFVLFSMDLLVRKTGNVRIMTK
jgi:hypothetical protein